MLELERSAGFDRTRRAIGMLIIVSLTLACTVKGHRVLKRLVRFCAVPRDGIADDQIVNISLVDEIRLVVTFIHDCARVLLIPRGSRVTIGGIIRLGYRIDHTCRQSRQHNRFPVLEGNLASVIDLADAGCTVRLLVGVFSVLALTFESNGVFEILVRIAAVAHHRVADRQLALGRGRDNERILTGYFYAVHPDRLAGRISYIHLINSCSR
ncbi:hypothetical protein D3C77_410090 [compost metagenome]